MLGTRLPPKAFREILSNAFSSNFIVQRLFVKCYMSNGFPCNFICPTAFREILCPTAFRKIVYVQRLFVKFYVQRLFVKFYSPMAFHVSLYVQRLFVKFCTSNGFPWNLYVKQIRVQFQSDTGTGTLQEDLRTFMMISRRVLHVLRKGSERNWQR
jgi:hypothetical protein